MALGYSFMYAYNLLKLKRFLTASRASKKARKVWDSNPWPVKDPILHSKKWPFQFHLSQTYVGLPEWDQDSNKAWKEHSMPEKVPCSLKLAESENLPLKFGKLAKNQKNKEDRPDFEPA